MEPTARPGTAQLAAEASKAQRAAGAFQGGDARALEQWSLRWQ